jgi:cell wall-associated NlpC family hydrolase
MFSFPKHASAFAAACVFAAGIFGSHCAWSADESALDTLVTELSAPESESTPDKLHALTNKASDLAMLAMSMLGIRYKFGSSSPELGFDCSGLVRYLYKEVWGTNLPRTAEEISRLGKHVDRKDLQTGDLVFYNTLRRGFSHVGIYLGDSKFIHSPAAGGQIRIESMNVGYWKNRFNGARRIGDPTPL